MSTTHSSPQTEGEAGRQRWGVADPTSDGGNVRARRMRPSERPLAQNFPLCTGIRACDQNTTPLANIYRDGDLLRVRQM